jgi:putative nucleotidyltransferase with HDIG domain
MFLLAVAAVAVTALYGRAAVVPGQERIPIRLIAIVVILGATAAFMWVVTDDADRHLDRLERAQRELNRAYELTLEGWAKILEYRDEETEGHSRRVADLAVALARELGLDEETVLNVRRGALLHDIGKLGVPDHILLKPGPLDHYERAIMQQHPVIARELIANIEFLQPALSIPYSHHERWDGAGYPEGLAGTDIPMPARLFAIVDQWEALTSDRPYRRAWRPNEALAYLHTNSGKIFDPMVVDAFVRVLDRLAAIPRPRHRAS